MVPLPVYRENEISVGHSPEQTDAEASVSSPGKIFISSCGLFHLVRKHRAGRKAERMLNPRYTTKARTSQNSKGKPFSSLFQC
jgi:hypothetical protein